MFTYFITFIENISESHFRIKESNENLKEFCEKTDGDGSLAVDTTELSNFFESYVKNGIVELNMADGMAAG